MRDEAGTACRRDTNVIETTEGQHRQKHRAVSWLSRISITDVFDTSERHHKCDISAISFVRPPDVGKTSQRRSSIVTWDFPETSRSQRPYF